jgi:hypothetical protein
MRLQCTRGSARGAAWRVRRALKRAGWCVSSQTSSLWRADVRHYGALSAPIHSSGIFVPGLKRPAERPRIHHFGPRTRMRRRGGRCVYADLAQEGWPQSAQQDQSNGTRLHLRRFANRGKRSAINRVELYGKSSRTSRITMRANYDHCSPPSQNIRHEPNFLLAIPALCR